MIRLDSYMNIGKGIILFTLLLNLPKHEWKALRANAFSEMRLHLHSKQLTISSVRIQMERWLEPEPFNAKQIIIISEYNIEIV